MKRSMTLGVVCLLTGCSAVAPQSKAPLASREMIAAAEVSELAEMAAEAHWNDPFPPFQMMGNIYYVGTSGVSSWLITTPNGHFLLDGGLPQSSPQVIESIRTLGFDIRDVKYLLNSHAHFDHAGGLAALQSASGAIMVASEADRGMLETGRVAYGPTADIAVPPVRVDRVVSHGETLSLGGVRLTAHVTPGHTPGCTSWSMEVQDANGQSQRVFFHCSTTTGGQSLAPESYPGMIAAYRATFDYIRTLKADIFLANHANFFGLQAKRARQVAGDSKAFVDPGEIQRFNAKSEQDFAAELARQQALLTAQPTP